MPRPLVSIITPFWNEALYINRCLDSIINQSYSNWELILINDGSTDESPDIAKKYEALDIRIKLIHKQNSGILASLALGFAKAEGQYITRMDADDEMPINRLELMQSHLFKLGRGNIVSGKIQYISAKPLSKGYQKYQAWINSLNTPEDFKKHLMVECVLPSPAWMMFTQDFQALNYLEPSVYPEDYNFTCKAITQGYQCHSLPHTLLLWREHPNRSSRIQDNYQIEKFWDIRWLYLNTYLKKFSFQIHLPVQIWGTGLIGKRVFKKLQQLGLSPIQWVDIHNSSERKFLYNAPIKHYQEDISWSNFFTFICVGDAKAKTKIEAYLMTKGLPFSQKQWCFLG
jgi:glycosyltransferase involved in cell wall biosynthesis